MRSVPLTHHDIIGLIEPFARAGLQVDLSASNRLERRLLFRPLAHAGPKGPLCEIRDQLRLDPGEDGEFRLTRTLTPCAGPSADLEAEGGDPAELLARISAIDPQRPFKAVDGIVIAISYRVAGPLASDAAGPTDPSLVMTRGLADVSELRLTLRPPTVRGSPGDVDIRAAAGEQIELPDDALAVLGWDVGVLEGGSGEWRATVRLPRNEPARTRRGEARLEQIATHLATLLANPPATFHERHARSRWLVALRRSVPLLIAVALLAGAFASTRLPVADSSVLRMLIMSSPALLMAVAFSLREVPRLTPPPLPRRSRRAAWRLGPASAAADGTREERRAS